MFPHSSNLASTFVHNSPNHSGIPCSHVTNEFHAFGIVSVKKVHIASQHAIPTSFMLFHISITAFLKSSFVVHNVISAVITAPIIPTIKPIPLALVAAFNANCARAAPSFAFLKAFIALTTPCIIDATFHANNPVAIPPIVVIIAAELLTINPTNSPIFSTIPLNISLIS